MISNERPSPYGGRPRRHYPGRHDDPRPGLRPGPPEETLRLEKLQIERKKFIFTLKENPRGRFLRITEDVAGRRDNIIVPASGLDDFKHLVDEMVKTSNETPPKTDAV